MIPISHLRRSPLSTKSSGRLIRTVCNSRARDADFAHVVIGAGVVGLAVARHLAAIRPASPTLLLERHSHVGTETSSRNSEVIHAGIYYGRDSLKTRLCIRGKQLMYDFCARHGVSHRCVGKWIVAQDDEQRDILEKTHVFCHEAIDVPTRWVRPDEAQLMEPAVRAHSGILESPTTGIVDSYGLMTALHGLFEDAGGTTALNSILVAAEGIDKGQGGWRLVARDTMTGEDSTIKTDTLINCAGLGAVDVHNMILHVERRKKLHFAKGNYFSYGASKPHVSRLIYPVTTPGSGGLGTHLTLDLAGRLRFGPDLEWVDDPTQLDVSEARLPMAVAEIKKYLPSIDETALAPDYTGIRPKLYRGGAVGQGKGFVDFYIRKEPDFEGWINLLGIESPGLTSSLAIAEYVDQLLYGGQKLET